MSGSLSIARSKHQVRALLCAHPTTRATYLPRFRVFHAPHTATRAALAGDPLPNEGTRPMPHHITLDHISYAHPGEPRFSPVFRRISSALLTSLLR